MNMAPEMRERRGEFDLDASFDQPQLLLRPPGRTGGLLADPDETVGEDEFDLDLRVSRNPNVWEATPPPGQFLGDPDADPVKAQNSGVNTCETCGYMTQCGQYSCAACGPHGGQTYGTCGNTCTCNTCLHTCGNMCPNAPAQAIYGWSAKPATCDTCDPTCYGKNTCNTCATQCNTCQSCPSCYPTCTCPTYCNQNTCGQNTCANTCDTCATKCDQNTCNTCATQCNQNTCDSCNLQCYTDNHHVYTCGQRCL
jgi:hypothetical protein